MAIAIKVKRAPRDYELDASKFFGAPTVPLGWDGDFDEDEIFLCQLRLADIAALDVENRLPHTGYLYIFLHTDAAEYDLAPDVRYYDGEPELVIEDFNLAIEEYEKYNDAYLMEFSAVDDDAPCTRLFGEPSDWGYESDAPRLLLQFDPLDNTMGFLDHMDGFVYFFFEKDEKDFGKIRLHAEFS